MNKETARKIRKYLKLREKVKEAYRAIGMKRSTLSEYIKRNKLK